MKYPHATWRGPVPNRTPNGMGAIFGLVLHIQEGTEVGTNAWFHNSASQVSAHFGNPKSGPMDQWVDTADRAWAEVGGNSHWISIENEGNSGDQLTPSQLENAAELLAWLHAEYNVPLQISDTPLANTPGLTGHGLGGQAWGGHLDCPGTPILAQRQAIITRAAQIAGAPIPGEPVGNYTMTAGWKTDYPDAAAELDKHIPVGTVVDESAAAGYAMVRSAVTAYRAGVIEAKLDALAAKVDALAAIDVQKLAAALAPLLQAGATADQIATAVVSHLATTLAKG